MSEASDDVLNERMRQIADEGNGHDKDDGYIHRELRRAAACYVLSAWAELGQPEETTGLRYVGVYINPRDIIKALWPWDKEWWKPKNPRRDLVRAAALIIAELERMDRLEPARAKGAR